MLTILTKCVNFGIAFNYEIKIELKIFTNNEPHLENQLNRRKIYLWIVKETKNVT